MEEKREYRSWKRPEREERRFGNENGFHRDYENRSPIRRREEGNSYRSERNDVQGNGMRPKRPRIMRPVRNDRTYENASDFRERDSRPYRNEERGFAPRRRFQDEERTFNRENGRYFERRNTGERNNSDKPFRKSRRYYTAKPDIANAEDGLIRLNKYISNSGVCSRREADLLIAAGSVTVNGEVVTQMGYKVKDTDEVCYDGRRLSNERKVYLLLNKPKGFITTVEDPQDRKTVMALVGKACRERIYPVGRLDRSTSGLLLFTNDGELTKKLTHPSYGARKIYHVELDKPVTKADMQTLLDGMELEDGIARVDDIQYVETANSKKVVGVELHSGKNRIVRRMFNHLGYKVEKLDRVCFAGLTKKDIPRGHYRFLDQKEVAFLKM